MIRLLVALAAGLFLAACAPARPPASVPDAAPALDGARIRSGVDTLAMYLHSGGHRERIGRVIDRVRVVRAADGRARLQRVYISEEIGRGTRVDTLVDERRTLRPVRFRSRNAAGEVVALEFAGTRVRHTTTAPGAPPEATEHRFDAVPFNAASFDLVLRSSPLHDGARLVVPAYLPSTGNVAELVAVVAGSEPVPGDAGQPVETWRVEADVDGLPVTFWISKQTGDLVRQQMRVAPGVEILLIPWRLDVEDTKPAGSVAMRPF